LIGYLHLVAARIAAGEGLAKGFRTVINSGPDGGQTVDHLHVHLLGGRAMTWPPG
jgi:histidine triad (HIT) family protein